MLFLSESYILFYKKKNTCASDSKIKGKYIQYKNRV